jgi:hypothetical protein
MGAMCCNSSKDIANVHSPEELLEFFRNELSMYETHIDILKTLPVQKKVPKLRFYTKSFKTLVRLIIFIEKNTNNINVEEIKYNFVDIFESIQSCSEDDFNKNTKKISNLLKIEYSI